MTLLDQPDAPPLEQHIVLEDVSWEFYEQLLREIGDGHIRATYDEGRLEIMSPLPKHDRYGRWIARLIILMCEARSLEVELLGSTTFKNRQKQKGLEPDECFYIQNAAASLEMDRAFDPAVDPPPDLAVEIDITSRSVPREPIYTALGVPELWRFDGRELHVLHLVKGKYLEKKLSLAFPFLPMAEFAGFVLRAQELNKLRVTREFGEWLAKLPA